MNITREFVYRTFKRAPGWSRIRKMFIKCYPECAACGKTTGLEVHHVLPFFFFPLLELLFSNLITLCRKCHYTVGHGGKSWKHWNVNVREACKLIRYGAKERP